MATDLERGLDAIDNARKGYDKAHSYFEGTVPEVFSSTRIANWLSSEDEAFYLNYARIPVVSRLSRIEIAAVSVADSESLTSILQEQVWNENDLLLQQKELHLLAMEYGDAYLSVWPSSDGLSVDINVEKPLGVRMVYSVENRRKAEYAIKIWATQFGTYRADLYYPDRIEQWVSLEGKPGAKEQWVEFTGPDSDEYIIPNPFNRIPFFHFSANGHPYGTPVHKNAFGPQDSITKTNKTLNSAVEFMGFPQRYALTDKGGVDNEDTPEGWAFGASAFAPDEPATQASGNAANLKGGAGEMLFIEGIKQVGTFSPADAKNFLETLSFHVRSMAQTTETPMHYFDPQGDAPSGESLRTAEAPFIKSVDDLKVGFTRPWASALSFAMEILGYSALVHVRFAESQSNDDKAAWETVQAKIDAGVPRFIALMEAGYTSAQLDLWGVSKDSTPKDEAPAPTEPDTAVPPTGI